MWGRAGRRWVCRAREERQQLLVRLLRGGRPVLRVLGQQAQDERFEGFRHLGAQPAHRERRLVEVTVQHAERGGAGERYVAAEEFVDEHAERVQIGVRADRAAHRLLGAM
ncbi:hypothetical protein SAV14893_028740 [Streptomyces avermitilis]|uniref:Uncharacterized protein n=1 Tax=Streptomyces avermitilis TaxID=33903 RepID=A0A4D4LPK6_STRAX|nr:hypothetical protein SAV14893_028740 [Streptomyces avermitilis]